MATISVMAKFNKNDRFSNTISYAHSQPIKLSVTVRAKSSETFQQTVEGLDFLVYHE